MVKPSFLAILLIVTLSLTSIVSANSDQNPLDIHIEQIQANLPVLNAYITGSNDTTQPDAVEAFWGKEKLTVTEVRPYNRDNDGLWLLFLVDCSTSVNQKQMNAVQTAITSYIQAMGPKDTATLITFGETVEVPFNKASRENEQGMMEAVGALERNQEGTLFYDAFMQAMALAEGDTSPNPGRKAALVFSDSVDVNVGGYTPEEINRRLSAAPLPFYAMGFDTGDKSSLDQFGAMARQSGGTITLINPETLREAFAECIQNLNSGLLVQTLAASNKLPEGEQLFRLSMNVGGERIQMERPVKAKNWQADNRPPSLVSVEQVGEETLRLTFDKTLLGAENPANYLVMEAETAKGLAIQSAVYAPTDKTVLLTFAQAFASGSLHIAFENITDTAMEQNKLVSQSTIEVIGPEVAAQSTEEAPSKGAQAGAWFILTLVVVAIAAAVIVGKRKKNSTQATEMGRLNKDVQLQQQAAQDTDKVDVMITPGVLPVLVLKVIPPSGQAQRLTLNINKSAIFGRAELCDVTFNDQEMSRQHFAIEEEQGIFSLANLSETNGTFLNGVKVNRKRRLNPGDTIAAGQMRLVVER